MLMLAILYLLLRYNLKTNTKRTRTNKICFCISLAKLTLFRIFGSFLPTRSVEGFNCLLLSSGEFGETDLRKQNFETF